MSAGELETCLVGKLRAEERAGSKHRMFRIRDDAGRVIATTAMSRSWRRGTIIRDSMVATIRRELGLQGHGAAFDDLIECPLSRDGYIELLTGA